MKNDISKCAVDVTQNYGSCGELVKINDKKCCSCGKLFIRLIAGYLNKSLRILQ